MPINQYDNPVRYEYKPLGLDKLVAPMAAMQKKFDVTQSMLDDAEFKLQHTAWGTDPERAKAIITEYEGKRDQIANDLMSTKNFRKATQQLKNLNKAWNSSPEAKALATNYTHFKERDEEERQRYLKGDIRKKAYEAYRARDIKNYAGVDNKGGTNFSLDDAGASKYTSLSRHTALNDMSKDFDDTKIKLMEMNPEEIKSFFYSNGFDGNTGDKKFVDGVIKEKEAGKLSSKTEAALRSMTRFKDWVSQGAEIDYLQKYGQGTEASKANSEELLNSTISAIDRKIDKLTPKLDPDGEITLNLLRQKNELTEAMTGEGGNQEMVKRINRAQYENNLYDSDALANLMAYKNVTSKTTFRSMPKATSNNSSDTNDLFKGLGEFTGAGYQAPTLGTLGKSIDSSNKKTYSSIKGIHNLVGGTFRDVVMGGWRPKEERNALSMDKGQMLNLDQAVLTAYTNSNNYGSFYNSLYSNGMRPKPEDARKLYNAFKEDGNYLTTIQEKLVIANDNYSEFENTKLLRNNIRKDAMSTSDFAKSLNEYHSYTMKLTSAEYAKAKKLGIVGGPHSGKNVVWGSDKKGYTSNAYVKARVMGYKDLADAVKKGEKFGGQQLFDRIGGKYNLSELVNPAMVKSVNKNQLLTNRDFAQVYVGDKVITENLNRLFATEADLLNYRPNGALDWRNQAGFDANGNLKPGTKLLKGKDQGIGVAKVGSKMMLTANIEWKDSEDGTHTSRVYMNFPKHANPHQQRLLDRIDDSSSQNNDALSRSINDTVKAMKFDHVQKQQAINNSMFYNSKTGDVFATVPAKDPNGEYKAINIQFVKVFQGGKNVIKLRQVDSTTGEVLVNADGGRYLPSTSDLSKDYFSTDIDAAKGYVATILDY